MPYGPHVADDRARMLATIGVASVDDLFEDIPARPAREPAALDRRGARARAERRGSPALAARNRVDLASFLGAGAYRHWTPAGRRPAAAARRVVHGLHAVPARGQPGHAAEHLRVPVAARRADRARRRVRVALRRRRGDRRGGADDRAARRAATGVLVSPRASIRTTARRCATYAEGAGLAVDEVPLVADGPGRRHDRPRGARAAARRRRTGRSRASSRPSPTSSACSRTCPRSGGSPTPPARCSSSVIEPVSLAVLAPPGRVRRGHRRGRGPAAGHPAPVRRPVPRDRRLHRRARPPDPRPAGRA